MTLADIRNSITLLIIGLYMILNGGFMLVRVPPAVGSGVPVGELLLIFFVLTFLSDSKWLPHFSRSIFLVPFVLWWGFGIGRALVAVPEHGMWALRDATHLIESLFLWVGFVFAADPRAVDRLFVWLRRLLSAGVIYAFTYPFRETLKDLSPTIQAAAGYTTTVLFHYRTGPVLLLMEASRRMIAVRSGAGTLLIAGFLVSYAVTLFQARAVYLQVIAILLLLGWQRRAAFGRMGLAIAVAALLFIAFIASGVEVMGRLGQPISLEFLVNHFAAIWGRSSPGVEGPASGVSLRLDWWAIIWRQLTDDPVALFFGLGYGFPLIDFLGGHNQIVREPHNSYMSILGRMGLFGIAVFTWGHVLLLRAWFRAYGLCRRTEYRIGQDRLLLLMVYFVLIWVFSLGESAFEVAYLCIPYYFFWGVVLHYGQHLQRQLVGAAVPASAPHRWMPRHLHARPPGS